MDVIVDTHAAIWFITDNKQLPESSKKIIEEPKNNCYVSIATLWEMGIKYSLGKLKLKAELKRIFELFFESGFLLLPITPDHILTNASLAFHHRDPFDRLIIAQAKREGYALISKDAEFDKYDVNLIWN
ncbi:type II toxin-antitoxin system VapC family toxin [Fodinibius halophilus]|uniref:Type II toxin-antitoxin system VapC family toxin n=1 Tax=Fodinibius halophilus TaxID=1736908 RepID=A0A6M1T2R5_9BACT|nr:type II toxin-antitoxin system VapC family toxin [Fodinibius halophilus]NGP88329.1 type II toxin-antitoxin system VapC family toxin [Fodinibius halophilus]